MANQVKPQRSRKKRSHPYRVHIIVVSLVLIGILAVSGWFLFGRFRSKPIASVLENMDDLHEKRVVVSGTALDVTKMPFVGKNVFLLIDGSGEIFVMSTLPPPAEASSTRVIGIVKKGVNLPVLKKNIGAHIEAERVKSRPSRK